MLYRSRFYDGLFRAGRNFQECKGYGPDTHALGSDADTLRVFRYIWYSYDSGAVILQVLYIFVMTYSCDLMDRLLHAPKVMLRFGYFPSASGSRCSSLPKEIHATDSHRKSVDRVLP